MRKKNGFMLMETLIASAFVGVTLVILFVQLQNISTSYMRTFTYNTANNLYSAKTVKRYLATRNYDNFIADLKTKLTGFMDITACDKKDGSSYYYVKEGENSGSAIDYCKKLYKSLRIKKVLLTTEDLTNTKHSITKNAEDFGLSQKLVDFVNHIKYDKNPNKFRLVIEFEDDTFASIQLSPSALENALSVRLNGSVSNNSWTASNPTLTTTLEPSLSILGNVTYNWQRKSGSGFVDATECGFGNSCIVASEGESQYRVLVQSSVFGSAYSNSYIIKRDTSVPSCTIEPKGTLGTDGFYKTSVLLTLKRSDNVGIQKYGLVNTNSEVYNAKDSITQGLTSGITYYGFVEDEAGNKGTCQLTVKVK